MNHKRKLVEILIIFFPYPLCEFISYFLMPTYIYTSIYQWQLRQAIFVKTQKDAVTYFPWSNGYLCTLKLFSRGITRWILPKQHKSALMWFTVCSSGHKSGYHNFKFCLANQQPMGSMAVPPNHFQVIVHIKNDYVSVTHRINWNGFGRDLYRAWWKKSYICSII